MCFGNKLVCCASFPPLFLCIQGAFTFPLKDTWGNTCLLWKPNLFCIASALSGSAIFVLELNQLPCVFTKEFIFFFQEVDYFIVCILGKSMCIDCISASPLYSMVSYFYYQGKYQLHVCFPEVDPHPERF